MVKQVTRDVTGGFCWSLLQSALEHQLSVLIGQFQIDELSGPELEVLVELHQVEMVFCLSGFHVDL